VVANGGAVARQTHGGCVSPVVPVAGAVGTAVQGGFHGIAPASQLLGVWPTLVARELIESEVRISVSET